MEKVIKVASYTRISTLLGQDTQNQLFGIIELSKQRNYNLVEQYSDEGISGKAERRPGLDRMLKDAKRGHFSIIIIHSIDRLGRSTKHLLTLIDELRHFGVSIISIRENIDFTSPVGQMSLTMLSAVAQLEAQLISERIKTSLAVKKAIATRTNNGWTCGRPSLDPGLVEKVIELRTQGKSVREISKILGSISKSSVSRIINENHLSRKANAD